MTVEEVTKVLRDAGYLVHTEDEIQDGVQLRLISPQIVNVFHTGTVQVQGKPPVDLRSEFAGEPR